MKLDPAHGLANRQRRTLQTDRYRRAQEAIIGCISLSRRRHERVGTVRGFRLVLSGVAAVMLALGAAVPASAQSLAVLDQPPAQVQMPAKPMTPERIAWLKGRCAQLVAFFDYYGVSRGENSDGPRNHTRIGAAVDCSQMHYRTGIDTMADLLKRKAFDLPNSSVPVIEPEDVEAPDITNPTQQPY